MTTPAPAPTTPAGASAPAPAVPAAPAPAKREPSAQNRDLTSKLFPDFVGEDGTIYGSPSDVPRAAPGAPAAATPPARPAAGTPPAPAPTREYLDVAQISDRWVKLTVDGVETEMQVKDAVKSIQLERHLTQRGQALAEQEKTLREIRSELLTRPAPAPAKPDDPNNPDPGPSSDPSVAKLEKQLAETQRQLAEVMQVTSDVRVKKAMESIHGQVQKVTGFDDFMLYVPEIQRLARSKCVDPNKPTAQEIALYDTPMFYQSTYMEMKMKDLAAGKGSPAPAPAPSPTPPGRGPDTRPIPDIEGAGGAPRIAASDDWQTRYDAAFDLAVETGRNEHWVEVVRLKREKPVAR